MSSAAADPSSQQAAEDDDRKLASSNSNEQQEGGGEFVNQGLRLWEQSRTKWLGHKTNATAAAAGSGSNSAEGGSDSTARPAAVPIEVDEIIEVVFAMPRQTAAMSGTDESSGPPKFPRTVPLPQMVDILVDLWEAEGLDI